jgi:hypothetical protein
MQKLFGTALVAAIFAGSMAGAQEIRPLETTPATQGTTPTIVIGALELPVWAVVGSLVTIAGITYLVVEANDGT